MRFGDGPRLRRRRLVSPVGGFRGSGLELEVGVFRSSPGAARDGGSRRALAGFGLAARHRLAWGLGHNERFLSSLTGA